MHEVPKIFIARTRKRTRRHAGSIVRALRRVVAQIGIVRGGEEFRNWKDKPKVCFLSNMCEIWWFTCEVCLEPVVMDPPRLPNKWLKVWTCRHTQPSSQVKCSKIEKTKNKWWFLVQPLLVVPCFCSCSCSCFVSVFLFSWFPVSVFFFLVMEPCVGDCDSRERFWV